MESQYANGPDSKHRTARRRPVQTGNMCKKSSYRVPFIREENTVSINSPKVGSLFYSMALYTRVRCIHTVIAEGTHLGGNCPALQSRNTGIPRPRLFRPISAASGASGGHDDLPSTSTSMSSEDSSFISSGEGKKPRPFWGAIPKIDKEMIATLGFGAFSAYGVISNINAGVLAWPICCMHYCNCIPNIISSHAYRTM